MPPTAPAKNNLIAGWRRDGATEVIFCASVCFRKQTLWALRVVLEKVFLELAPV